MKKKMYPLMMLFLTQCAMSFADNTDISTLDNVIYVEPFTLEAGTESSISFKMKNTAAIRSFGFDLYLPDGITAVPKSDGNPRGSLNYDRVPKDEDSGYPLHQMTLSYQEGNVIRFLCDAQEGQSFIGNDGEIATLRVNVSETMAEGDYPIIIRTQKLSETDISIYYETAYVESTVTITEPGDGRTVLDEDSETPPASAPNVNVRVKRKIKANEWSTIVLPFAMTEEQVKNTFGDDVLLADFIGTDPEFDGDNVVAVTANFTAVQAIEANHPYIIKVSSDFEEFTLDGVDIVANEDEAYIEFDNGKTGSRREVYSGFYGTYHAQTVLDEFTLFLSDNKFWYSTGLTKMRAFRAYFDFLDILTEVKDGSANVKMFVNTDNDATGIHSLNADLNSNETIYNLAGQRVGKNYKGIVIENGKKIMK